MSASSAFPSLLVVSSLALLVHATLCAIQHREYLKAVQQPFVYSPFAVSMQCMIAVGLGMWGVLGAQGSFMAIRTTEVLGKQTVDNLEPGVEWMHFATREMRVYDRSR